MLQSLTSASVVSPPVVNGVSGAQNTTNMWGKSLRPTTNHYEDSFNRVYSTVFDFDICNIDTYKTMKL